VGERKKLLVIGLDGATFDLLQDWLDEGKLPTLRGIAEGGVIGELTTVFPPVTAPAWTTFMTGKNPGKHGVYEFLLKDGSPVNSNLKDGKAVWEILSDYGRKVIVIGVPVTYPPKKVKGMLISGFLTPRRKRDFTYPPELLDEIESKFGSYRLYLNKSYVEGREHELLDELFEVFDYRRKVVNYLLENYDWDFFMFHILGIDRIQHELWHILDHKHHAHKEGDKRYRRRIVEYFQRVDQGLGEIVEKVGDDTVVMIMSDHGFGPIYKFMSFNVWLLKEGFLKLKRGPITLLKRAFYRAGMTPELGYKIAMKLGLGSVRVSKDLEERSRLFAFINRLLLSFNNVDWSRTIAYSKGNYGQIFINLRGREPFGIVEPGKEYEEAREEIIRRLKEIKDPDTGERIIGEIYRCEEIYHGKYLREAPDISFLPRDMSYKALGTLAFMSSEFIRDSYGLSGDRRMKGILICSGRGIKRGKIEGANIVDLAPTILYIMGEKIPEDMDGKVLTGIFTEEHLRANPIEFTEGGGEQVGGFGCSPEDIEEIKARLRTLGYV